MTASQRLADLQTLGCRGGVPDGNTYDLTVDAYLRRLVETGPESVRTQVAQMLRSSEPRERELRNCLPTPYQSVQDYERLLRAREDIEQGLKSIPRFPPVENLVFGSRETSVLNAHCERIPETGEHLIVFNRGLLGALLVTSNLVVYALDCKISRRNPCGSNAFYHVNAKKVRNFASSFAHVLDSTSQGRSPAPDITMPFGLLGDEEKEWDWTVMEDAATDFVFAHEYAHIVCGHVGGEHNWALEYQADTEGLELVGNAWVERFQGDPITPLYLALGVCTFFALLLRIEEYRARVQGDRSMVWSPAHSHPPTTIRWLRLHGQMERAIPGVGLEQFLNAQLNIFIPLCIDEHPTTLHPQHAVSHLPNLRRMGR
jgi:hypothetical protein